MHSKHKNLLLGTGAPCTCMLASLAASQKHIKDVGHYQTKQPGTTQATKVLFESAARPIKRFDGFHYVTRLSMPLPSLLSLPMPCFLHQISSSQLLRLSCISGSPDLRDDRWGGVCTCDRLCKQPIQRE